MPNNNNRRMPQDVPAALVRLIRSLNPRGQRFARIVLDAFATFEPGRELHSALLSEVAHRTPSMLRYVVRPGAQEALAPVVTA